MTKMYKKTLAEHLESTGEKKRILALDGGGLKGLVSVGILESLESTLRHKYGNDPEFRLSDHFDLISGTSTGAIIAAALSLGWSVEEVKKTYFDLGFTVFKRRFWQGRFFGLITEKFSASPLEAALKKAYGEDTTLGSDRLKTGLLVVTKRIDTGSTWPLSNNPKAKYFEGDPSRGRIGNKQFKLWRVVRASTAASTYFKPEEIKIFEGDSITKHVVGRFIDGGLSPYNDPALQSVMVSTISGYGFSWPLGENNLQVVSVGTGIIETNVAPSRFSTGKAIRALTSLMNDSADLQKTLLQWISNSPIPTFIDSQVGTLSESTLGGSLIEYLRYDANMTEQGLKALFPNMTLKLSSTKLENWDNPQNMDAYFKIGQLTGSSKVDIEHLT